MVEEVEIKNVGNNGVASEATLKLLLAAIDRMSKATGSNSTSAKDETKTLFESIKANIEATKAKKENPKAKKENTQETKKLTSEVIQLTNFFNNALTVSLGAVTGSVVNLSSEFLNSQTSLTAFAKHFPFFGEKLILLSDYLVSSVEALQSLTSVGATFNNSLVELRLAAAESHMSLSEYTDMVRRNSERLASFGGTVTNGAAQVRRLFTAMGPGLQQELMSMGLTVSDINEGLIFYEHLTRAGARSQQRDAQAQAQAAAEYIKNINTLSKLTGQDAKAMQDKLAAQQADVAFQMRLSRLAPDERDKVMQGLAEAMSMAGETGALYFKQQFLGLPPLTRETQLFAATMGESAAAIAQMQRDATNAGVSLSDFRAGSVDRLADFVEGSARAGSRLEDVLAAASGGLQGPAAELAAIFKEQGIEMTKYLENGKFNRQLFESDIRAAQAELEERDRVTTAMAAFTNNINTVRNTILTTLVDSGVFELAATAVESFSLLLSKIFTPNVIASIGNFIKPFVEIFEKFNEDLTNATGNIGEIVSNFVGSLISQIGSSLGNVVVEAWNAMWNNPATTAKIIGGVIVGLTAIFAARKITNFFKSLITGGDDRRRDDGAGAGNWMRSMGRSMRILAVGFRAFANPATAMGIGLITVAISALAIAIGTAVRIAGPHLEEFGLMLKHAFEGPAAIFDSLFTNLAVMFGEIDNIITSFGNAITGIISSIGNAISGVISSMSDFVDSINRYRTEGINATTEQIVRLSEISGDKLLDAARGVEALGLALKSYPVPSGWQSFVAWATGGAGVDIQAGTTAMITSLAEAFSNIDPEQINAASAAVTNMGNSLIDFGQGVSANAETLRQVMQNLFGLEDTKTSIMGKIRDIAATFGAIDSEKVIAGSSAVALIGGALSTFQGLDLGNFVFNRNFADDLVKIGSIGQGLKDAAAGLRELSSLLIIDIPETTIESIQKLVDSDLHLLTFSPGFVNDLNILINSNEILDNVIANLNQINAIPVINNSIAEFNSSLETDIVNSYATAIDQLKTSLDNLSNLEFNTRFVEDLINIGEIETGVSAAVRVLQNLANIPNINVSTVTIDSINKLADSDLSYLEFDNEFPIQIERIANSAIGFRNVIDSMQTLTTITGIDSPIKTFNDALNVDAVSAYTTAIEELKTALEKLNEELAENNDTFLQERISAGELVQNVTTANITNAENIQSLNTTLLEILRILTENKEIDSRIERNTRSLGPNISSGPISNF